MGAALGGIVISRYQRGGRCGPRTWCCGWIPAWAERLEAVAEVEGRSVSDVVREAIAALVEARQQDERFIRLLEDNVARHQRLLQMLRDEK